MIELFGRTYLKVELDNVLVNGFKVTRIFQLNSNLFSGDYFNALSITKISQTKCDSNYQQNAAEIMPISDKSALCSSKSL